MSNDVGNGGFIFPQVFKQSKDYVTKKFNEGLIDHADFSSWGFADHFFAYLLKNDFMEFIDRTFPSPREKTEVPIWFLICCQISMRITLKNSYHAIPDLLLNSGPILLRSGFNVSQSALGFNRKNKKERKTYVDESTVLKFFKDTPANDMRNWYNIDLQSWFREQKYYDDRGIYILDQTHCVVPDNKNYEDAVRMPLNEHGQRYRNFNDLTAEQKKMVVYHPCYALSFLMHASHQKKYFHIAGYEWGPGNIDELPQGRKLIDDFNKHSKKKMKLLIVDRGYLDGTFINYLKDEYGTDVLIPLRKDMFQYQDAIALSKFPDVKWEEMVDLEQSTNDGSIKYRACLIDKICLWDACHVPLQTIVVEKVEMSCSGNTITSSSWVLATTKKYKNPLAAVADYKLRTSIEERNRQLKKYWQISKFASPHKNLIEAQVCFILLAYSLVQSFLQREDLQKYASKTIAKLKEDNPLGVNNFIVYTDDRYAVYHTREALSIVNKITDQDARNRLQEWIDGGQDRSE